MEREGEGGQVPAPGVHGGDDGLHNGGGRGGVFGVRERGCV